MNKQIDAQQKTIAFLINCPSKGKAMIFPDYYEVLKEQIDRDYEPTNEYDMSEVVGWSAGLMNTTYKVFKAKPKTKQ